MPLKTELLQLDKPGAYFLEKNQVVHIPHFVGCLICIMDEYENTRGVMYFNEAPGLEFERQLIQFISDFKTKNNITDIRTVFSKFVTSGFYLKSIEELMNDFNLEFKGKAIGAGESYEVFFYAETNKLRIAKSESISDVEDQATRVLIVDDSPTIRKILKNLLSQDARFEVVGEAELPSQVQPMITRLKPDVITLDINMPEMSGVDLLKEYFPKYKIPTIMITSLNIADGTHVLEALENGAIDYIQKPSLSDLEVLGPILREKILVAHKSQQNNANRFGQSKRKRKAAQIAGAETFNFEEGGLVVVGASTGGTEAVKNLLKGLPDNIPSILIGQHIPAYFSKAFADRLNSLFKFTVKEAEDGEAVLPGVVYIAPGGKQMRVSEEDNVLKICIEESLESDNHSPSIDRLLKSVSRIRRKSVGVILTGMGSDGAKGLLEMRRRGCYTIAQDEASSVVYGMPKVAYEIGAATIVLDLLEISQEICEQIQALNKVS